MISLSALTHDQTLSSVQLFSGGDHALSLLFQARRRTSNMGQIFQNKGQIDVIAILMILGESTIWKAIWSRFRSRRAHWSQWIFAISPGWAPLASTLFALLGSSSASPNLIFSRPPESTHDTALLMTNLNSGASHSASNTVLQNVWHVWNNSARRMSPSNAHGERIDITKEVGIVDVNLDSLLLKNSAALWLQAVSLTIQFVTAFSLGLLKWNFETSITLIVGLIGQTLLLLAITPSEAVWNRSIRGHRCMPMMLHRALDSTEVLIIRSTILHGKEVSLEEFAWSHHAGWTQMDTIKLLSTALAFVLLLVQICFINWMDKDSRLLYLGLGALGLAATALEVFCSLEPTSVDGITLANSVEATSTPDWSKAYRQSFSGKACCAPRKSSLLSAVGLLLAAEFPSASAAARALFPANQRFDTTLKELKVMLDDILCPSCRKVARVSRQAYRDYRCSRQGQTMGSVRNQARSCDVLLADKVREQMNKQYKDALATVACFLSSAQTYVDMPAIETTHFKEDPFYTWVMPT